VSVKAYKIYNANMKSVYFVVSNFVTKLLKTTNTDVDRSKPGENCPFFQSRFSQWIHVP